MPHEPSREFVGVVVAAGSAGRFGAAVPKQFLDLAGRSVLRRSVDALNAHPDLRGVVVVLSADECGGPRGREVAGWPGVLRVVPGAATRAGSVRNGLRAVGDAPYVLVHDAARPLVPAKLIEAVLQATRRTGAAIPGLPVADTVKRRGTDGRVAATLDRAALVLAQTPQGARRESLLQALDHDAAAEATDEAMALERAGHAVEIVPGDPINLKITTPDDLETARRRLGGGPMEYRIGSGFDVHRFDAERRLRLGGIDFPGESGLAGHSDADVVLHAAMDALLGAAALGDIGALFPPDDPAYAGADSAVLAGKVARRVAEAGFEPVNLDLTLLAERPKIRPRVDVMRQRIAECFGLPVDRVGLKATTLERLGSLGRSEGIACQAVALVRVTGSVPR